MKTIKQPSGDRGIAHVHGGRTHVLSSRKSDAEFWALEKELQREQRLRNTRKAVSEVKQDGDGCFSVLLMVILSTGFLGASLVHVLL